VHVRGTSLPAEVWGAPAVRAALVDRGVIREGGRARVVIVGVDRDADLDAIRRAIGAWPGAAVLVVVPRRDSAADARRILLAFERGASAAVPANAPVEELAHALAELAEHRPVVHPFTSQLLIRALRARAAPHTNLAITAREREVLGLLVEGHTIADIARSLGIAFYTVQTHVKSLYRKLDVGSKAAATATALRHQLV
jgi:DNA-binding NarL/FixJ family response regulator